MNKYKELRKKMITLRREMRREGKAYFKAGAAAIFERWPELEWFRWYQYTPYWNDGEECIFDIYGEADLMFKGVEYVDGEYEEEIEGLNEVLEEIGTLLHSVDEDDMKQIFGDHVQVTVRRDGTVEAEDYDHD